MKMKKFGIVLALSALCLAALLGLGASAANVGDVVGNTLYTDIVAYIDDKPIQSHNINGFTAVVAEDLANYGFEVIWNGKTRALYISEGDGVVKDVEVAIATVSSDIIGKRFRDVRHTDIKTYLNDKLITSYNIGGYTIIMFEDLISNGDVKYDNSKRRLDFSRKKGNNANKIQDVYIIPEKSKYLKPGGFFEFEAIAEYGDGTTEDYSGKLKPYVYSGDDCLEINGKKVTAKSEGKAVIKFNGSYVKDKKVEITVNSTGADPTVSSIKLETSATQTLSLGQSFEIKATATYTDGSTVSSYKDIGAYIYAGSGVVKLQNNKVTAIANGVARIRFNASTLYEKEIVVSVVDKEDTIKSLAIDETSKNISIGKSFTITATATYYSGEEKSYTTFSPYIYSGYNYITLSGKTVKGIKAGTAIIKFNDELLSGVTLAVTVGEEIDSVSLDYTTKTVGIGKSFTISATAEYEDESEKAYTEMEPYVYSGSSYVTLSGNTVKGKKAGTAKIKFKDDFLKSKTLTVTVIDLDEIADVYLDYTSATIEVGESFTIEATAEYEDGEEDEFDAIEPYIYSGSSYITLSGNKVKGVKAGTAKIKFKDDFLKSKTLTVKVTEDDSDEIESVSLDFTSKSVAVGKYFYITATAEYEDGDEDEYDDLEPYIYSGSSYITLSGTKVKGVKAGTAKIKFKDDFLSSKTLTVKVTSSSSSDEIESVSLDFTSKSVAVGKSFYITATAEYEDGDEDEYDDLEPYIYSGSSYITLSGTKVKGVKAGTAKIKFKDDYLSSKTLTVKVTADDDDAEIESVEITSSLKKELAVGKYFTITAEVTYEDGDTDSYTSLDPYIYSGEDYVTLSGNKVTAKAAGVAKIKFENPYLTGTTITVTVAGDDDISSVTLATSTTKKIAIGESFDIEATVKYKDGTTDDYTDLEPYNSTENGVVSIKNNTVTGVESGTCKIKFESEYVTKTITVTVYDPKDNIKSVKLDSDEMTLAIGDKVSITATITYKDGTTAEYTDFEAAIKSGPKYITLSDGTITAKAAGTATIKFTDEWLEDQTITVEVVGEESNNIKSVKLDTAKTKTISTSDSFTILATATYESGLSASYTEDLEAYVSGDKDCVVIEGNKVIGVRAGECKIRFKNTYLSSSTNYINVTVKGDGYITAVTPSITEKTLTVGESVEITAEAEYYDEKTEEYTKDLGMTSTSACIEIDGNKITALKAGTATVKFTDSYLKSTTITITVEAAEAEESSQS